jgi:hypothetical protein
MSKLEGGVRVVTTEDQFEVWDGGHCFFRVFKMKSPYGKTELNFERAQNPFRLNMMKEFAKWVERLPAET